MLCKIKVWWFNIPFCPSIFSWFYSRLINFLHSYTRGGIFGASLVTCYNFFVMLSGDCCDW